jgi:hypothetical protein
MSERDEARFWSHVDKSADCWTWNLYRNSRSYGQFVVSVGGKARAITPSRFSWELHNGPVPKGMLVCHRCDNRICVRPDHLFLGTAKDNSRDASRKGRFAAQKDPRIRQGDNSPGRKLSSKDVLDIRRLSCGGMSQRELASKFSISKGQIYNIVHRKQWNYDGL